jgi:hypothetical protein
MNPHYNEQTYGSGYPQGTPSPYGQGEAASYYAGAQQQQYPPPGQPGYGQPPPQQQQQYPPPGQPGYGQPPPQQQQQYQQYPDEDRQQDGPDGERGFLGALGGGVAGAVGGHNIGGKVGHSKLSSTCAWLCLR